MFDACKINSNCCHDDPEEDNKQDENDFIYEKNMRANKKELKSMMTSMKEIKSMRTSTNELQNIIEGKPDMSKSVEISQHTEREYVAITAYQPVDIVTKTVEVPFVRTIETIVPKITYESKIREVPKYYSKFVEKVVEVPEVKFIDKIVDVPRIQYVYKYAPKVEIKENIIKRPIIEKKYVEKFVEVPEVKEVKRFQEVETVEYVIKYVPKASKDDKTEKDENDGEENVADKEAEERSENSQIEKKSVENEEEYNKKDTRLVRNVSIDNDVSTIIGKNMMINQEDICTGVQQIYPYMFTRSMNESGMVINSNRNSNFDRADNIETVKINENGNSIIPTPRIEQVFKPKIVKNIEVQKHVPISVDVPIPYMVPKPIVVNVDVPVLKFRDTFVPVPVRRKIIPKIKWISDVYQVDCIKERPYLKIQDIIKPVPCDIEIKHTKFMERACAINPNELPQDDVHAMWIRVNAHLAEQKKKEYGHLYPYYRTESRAYENVVETKEESKNSSEGKETEEREIERDNFVSCEVDKMESKKSEDESGNENEKENGKENIFEATEGRSEDEKNVGTSENAENAANEEEGEKVEVEEVREDVGASESKMNVDEVDVRGTVFCKTNEGSGTSFMQDGMVYNIEGFNNFMNENDINYQKNLEEDPIACLTPNHPLAMTYLQNKWISTDTLRTHELYNYNFVNASVHSNINLQNRNSFTTDLMQNKDFLKSAHQIMSPFKPENIKNIENCYNRIIMKNAHEENNKYVQDKYNKNNFHSNFNTEFINEKYMNSSEKKKCDHSEDQCCNCFCG
ncbi:inner membrane complex protein 1a, putative [Plasmodium chabaudi chabaudi]|uniref:Inner membrane complex protein 1a, putative n=1 Tax=Plasmodium chabaudi chabaudi TaxID=31271 RepID=A0A1D3LBQ9_PLACU|nr:inner membrane complex protein 1a, putative [Plasmodium chabaudi chabaudi]